VLVGALERGVCPELRVLEVGGGSHGQVGAVCRALVAFPRPALRELHLCALAIREGFGHVLRSGACRGLKILALNHSWFEGEGAAALFEVLGEGACPGLTELSLQHTGIKIPETRRLSRAIQAGGLAHLERLDLGSNHIVDDGVVALAEALGTDACPRLATLGLRDVGMGTTGCRALARAVRDGAFASLTTLQMSANVQRYYCLGVEDLIEAASGYSRLKVHV
jgi:hypothetical protein